MLWIKCWAIGLAISGVVAITTIVPTRLRALSVYLVAPLFPGFLLSEAIPIHGPPVGYRFLIMWYIAPVLSGSLVYGLLVYLILRLRKMN
jgi:hypothetical protein